MASSRLSVKTQEEMDALAAAEGAGPLVADRRLFLDESRTKLVEPEDPAARFLLVATGVVISASIVRQLRLSKVDGKVTQLAEKSAEPPKNEKHDAGEKEKAKPEDKAKGKPETKQK